MVGVTFCMPVSHSIAHKQLQCELPGIGLDIQLSAVVVIQGGLPSAEAASISYLPCPRNTGSDCRCESLYYAIPFLDAAGAANLALFVQLDPQEATVYEHGLLNGDQDLNQAAGFWCVQWSPSLLLLCTFTPCHFIFITAIEPLPVRPSTWK